MHDKTLITEFSTREIRFLNLYYYMFEDLTLSTDIIMSWFLIFSIPISNNVKATNNQCESKKDKLEFYQFSSIFSFVKIRFAIAHCTCFVIEVKRKGLEYGAKKYAVCEGAVFKGTFYQII